MRLARKRTYAARLCYECVGAEFSGEELKRVKSVSADGVARRALELLTQPDTERALADLLTEVGEDADARASVELALSVSHSLRERERRQRELSGLYETAGDLSSLRDLEQVLQAIVARARSLLGTDMAYLMLIDKQAGEAYVRVTDGVQTDAFKSARLGIGDGLGGLVAQTRRPYATADYRNDMRFRHTVDHITGAEGLVAVQGVPLLLRGDIIGVLFAANRRERPFDDAEVALLISLANHAAIAIETASLFGDVRAHSEMVERAASVHERLTALVAEGGHLPDVAAVIAEEFDRQLIVADPNLRVLATAGAAGGAQVVDGEQAQACRAAMDERATVSTQAGYATPVVAGSQILAALLLCGRTDLAHADVRTLERAALVSAILLLTERSIAEAEHRVRGELLDDLFAEPQPDAAGLRRRARLLGADLDRPHVVVVAHPQLAEDRRAVSSAVTAWAREMGGLCGEHGRSVVALIPSGDPATVVRGGAERARKRAAGPVTVGGGGPGSSPAAMHQAYRDARQCVDVLTALGQAGGVACPADLGAFALLFGPAGRARVDSFVRDVLGPVLDHDARRGTELLRTIEAYYACDANLARTATMLYIHINTLYQRMERITALLGEGWRGGQAALQLHLAVNLHRITTSAAHGA